MSKNTTAPTTPPENLHPNTLAELRDRCVILRTETPSEKVKDRLWRAASEFEAARKMLATDLRKTTVNTPEA